MDPDPYQNVTHWLMELFSFSVCRKQKREQQLFKRRNVGAETVQAGVVINSVRVFRVFNFLTVLLILIHVFLGLPDPLVRCMDPNPDPSIIKQK